MHGGIHPIDDEIAADEAEGDGYDVIVTHPATSGRPEHSAIVVETTFVNSDDVCLRAGQPRQRRKISCGEELCVTVRDKS